MQLDVYGCVCVNNLIIVTRRSSIYHFFEYYLDYVKFVYLLGIFIKTQTLSSCDASRLSGGKYFAMHAIYKLRKLIRRPTNSFRLIKSHFRSVGQLRQKTLSGRWHIIICHCVRCAYMWMCLVMFLRLDNDLKQIGQHWNLLWGFVRQSTACVDIRVNRKIKEKDNLFYIVIPKLWSVNWYYDFVASWLPIIWLYQCVIILVPTHTHILSVHTAILSIDFIINMYNYN